MRVKTLPIEELDKKVKKKRNNSQKFFEMVQSDKTKQIDVFIRKKDPCGKKFNFYWEDKQGNKVTHFAVFNQNIQLINFLIEHKVDFNLTNKSGVTPIMIAAYRGDVYIV